MSEILEKVLAANSAYASDLENKDVSSTPPGQQFAILTCMDGRLDPVKFMGLSEGEAHVIRNAGGRASDDAIRSLIISNTLLNTKEWFVIHHTDCGMEKITNESMRDALGENSIDWLTIGNQAESICADVLRIRSHPMVPKDVVIYGFLFDVKKGQLVEVPEANIVGKRL